MAYSGSEAMAAIGEGTYDVILCDIGLPDMDGLTVLKKVRRVDPDILRLQNRLGEALGARVSIQHQASGKGKLVIAYSDSDVFEGILERLDLAD